MEWLAKDIPRDAFDQDLLYSFGAFLTIGRVQRENAEQRILAAIGASPATEATVPNDEAPEAEAAIDPSQLAREQIRQHITQTIAPATTWPISWAQSSKRGASLSQSAHPDRTVGSIY